MDAGMSGTERNDTVSATLASVITAIEAEAALKKGIKEAVEPIDDIVRAVQSEINKLHSAPSSQHASTCQKCLDITLTAKAHWAAVAALIPKGEFYRYQFAIGHSARTLVGAIALARFILHDELVPAFTAAGLMGLSEEGGELQLTAEDYLQGVIGMVNELPRLSVNSVTSQNFELPIKIASFVNDIFASYSLLNLRNDALRRKFDSIKYDLKRCEDVVYDLTLRGLIKAPPPVSTGPE